LWDTGSTGCVITQATASALALIPTGSVDVCHAGGIQQRNTYLVNFYFPNKVGFIGIPVTECDNIVGNFGAIIGMDIITQGDFTITNVNGKTCMTFRIPSIKTVDYVVETNRMKYANVGRNDPCPCGKKDANGKSVKFKHCCGKAVL
jgi:hypothetical protein